jgi:hypothetical protein
MASPENLEKSGIYLFLFALSVIATLIGFLKGAMCGTWPCYYIFLGAALLFLAGTIKRIFF